MAIDSNHAEATKKLLEKGAKIDERHGDVYGNPPLYFAAERGYNDIVSVLLDYGADIEATGNRGNTALAASTSEGHATTIKLLIESGANSATAIETGGTLLQAAAGYGYIEAARVLLEHGGCDIATDDMNRITPMHAASQNGHIDMVKLLLEYGRAGQMGIHAAADKGHVDLIRFFVSIAGIAVDSRDYVGRTPLFLAARSRRYHAVKELLAQHAAVDARDIYEASPIFAAVRNGHAEVARLLLKADPYSLNSKDIFGHSPYWWASKSSQPNLLHLLDKVARNNGIHILASELNNGPDSPHMFASSPHWCDVCNRCVVDCKTAAHCLVCCADNFMICHDCVSKGMKCLDETHSIDSWERQGGCFNCRISPSRLG